MKKFHTHSFYLTTESQKCILLFFIPRILRPLKRSQELDQNYVLNVLPSLTELRSVEHQKVHLFLVLILFSNFYLYEYFMTSTLFVPWIFNLLITVVDQSKTVIMSLFTLNQKVKSLFNVCNYIPCYD